MGRHEILLDLLRRELSGDDWMAVVDPYDRGYRYRHGTLSRALAELVKQGEAVRRWDGNRASAATSTRLRKASDR